ncbi:neogenin-like [Teleopsis dalmanni]|uniref:neogenin-like n=1 Tax=Teleopsis dalmanni TaxID=139649 RepID=UPI0018CF7867|nr:neogenin-like [Teleopsis dalmanni]
MENNKSFVSVPTTIKTLENDTVLLPCYHNATFYFVRWHRDDISLVDSRHPETTASNRIHLFSNGSLQVSNVREEDSGEYYCEMMANNTHAVQVHAIEVQSPPILKAEPTGLLELPIGAIFELICEARGIPHPAITLLMNGSKFDEYHISSRHSFLIKVSSRYMTGPIECFATNGVGEPATAGVYLKVLYTPEISSKSDIVYTKINARAQLECIVESNPHANVHWFHNGIPLTFDLRITRHDTELKNNESLSSPFLVSSHVLVIRKVRDSDIGLYECRAQNKIGFKSITIDLTGRPMPCAFKINTGEQGSTSHLLVWQTESLSPVTDFKLKFRQITSENKTLQRNQNVKWTDLTIPSDIAVGPIYTASYTLRGLQPASIFEVIVLARNHFGWSSDSKTIRFTTGGEVELPNYSTESEMTEETFDEINEVEQDSHISSGCLDFRISAKLFYVLLGFIYILNKTFFTKS